MVYDWSTYENKKLEVSIMESKKLDLKITAKKVAIQALIVFVAGLASVYGNNPLYLAIAPAITGIVNIIKNK